tara:strand:- start:39617 stop:40531 length:915 start_codon:yes stop_codon:yes gene_type:complete
MSQKDHSHVWRDLSTDWLTWADRLAPQAGKINTHLIDALQLPGLSSVHKDRGLRVLDLASGVGEPAFGIAKMLAADVSGERPDIDNPVKAASETGLRGHVVASDIVPGMCDGLAARAQADGIGNLDVVVADMAALPFGAQTFDAISCRFGIMFCQNPDQALGETYRVLAPAGRAAFMLWAPMAHNPLFVAMEAVLRAEIGIGFDGAGLNLFGFADPQSSIARMKKAGFTDISLATHAPVGRIPAKAAFWRPQMEMLFGPYLRNAGANKSFAIDAAMGAELSQHIEDAHFRVPMCFHILSGCRGS